MSPLVFSWCRVPRVVGSSEVDFGAEAPLESFVHVELGTVISSDGVDGMRFVAQDVGGTVEGLLCTDARELANMHESALASTVTVAGLPRPWTVSISQSPSRERSVTIGGRSVIMHLPARRPRLSLRA